MSRRGRTESMYSWGGFQARVATAQAFHKNTMELLGKRSENAEEANRKFTSAGNLVYLAVNLIFACESYLKTFVMMSNKTIPENHNLWKIYKVISAEARAVIEKEYYAEIAKRPNRRSLHTLLSLEPHIPKDDLVSRLRKNEEISPKGSFDSLDRILKDTGDSYHAWRYLFESEPSKDKEKVLRLHYDHLDCLCIACHGIILRSIAKKKESALNAEK